MNKVREFRVREGLSQRQLANLTNLVQCEISRIEISGAELKSHQSKRAKIAGALGVTEAECFPDPPAIAPLRSSDYEGHKPAPMPPAVVPEETKHPRYSTCKWCGIKYNVEHEVKIMVGDKAIKIYGHLSCLEQDIRTDGLDLKKRGCPR